MTTTKVEPKVCGRTEQDSRRRCQSTVTHRVTHTYPSGDTSVSEACSYHAGTIEAGYRRMAGHSITIEAL